MPEVNDDKVQTGWTDSTRIKVDRKPFLMARVHQNIGYIIFVYSFVIFFHYDLRKKQTPNMHKNTINNRPHSRNAVTILFLPPNNEDSNI